MSVSAIAGGNTPVYLPPVTQAPAPAATKPPTPTAVKDNDGDNDHGAVDIKA